MANLYAGMADRSQAFTYTMVDMDKNGIEELIVSSKNGSEILDIFTLKDSKAIRLTNAENKMQMLGTRFKAYLLENGNLYTQWNPFAGDSKTFYAVWKLNSSGEKLEKIKEALTEEELNPGTRMNLSGLTWKSVTEKFTEPVPSTNQKALGKMDINAIKNGDFSSIEGRWSTGNGGQDLVFSKNGLIEPAEFYVDINGAVFRDGYLITGYRAPTIGAQLDMIPAGVVIPTVTEPNYVKDASDTSKDRMIIHQAPHAHGNAGSFYYKVK